MLLHRDPVELQERAISTPTITSADGQISELDWDRWENIVYPEVAAGEYTIRYQVGFEEKKIPAIVRETVILLATWFLLKDKKARSDALALLPIVRDLK